MTKMVTDGTLLPYLEYDGHGQTQELSCSYTLSSSQQVSRHLSGFPLAVARLWSSHHDLECCNLALPLSLKILLKWRAVEVSLSTLNGQWPMWELIWSPGTWKGRKPRLYVGHVIKRPERTTCCQKYVKFGHYILGQRAASSDMPFGSLPCEIMGTGKSQSWTDYSSWVSMEIFC